MHSSLINQKEPFRESTETSGENVDPASYDSVAKSMLKLEAEAICGK